jgi:Ser/Thr protein kinase RdoA (MazF antagonist)
MIVRTTRANSTGTDVAGKIGGPWFRTPQLFSTAMVDVPGGGRVKVECWEHLAGAVPDAAEVGRAAALLAATQPPRGSRRFDPFVRSHPRHLHLDTAVVAVADVVELHADARTRWERWCERYPTWGWTHGDWYDQNMLACADGSFFVLDLDDAGAGPVGFDLAALLTHRRFERYVPGTVEAAVAAYAPFSAVPVAEIAAWLEPVATYVVAARIAASPDPVRIAGGSARLASLVAERAGRPTGRWRTLADLVAEDAAHAERRPAER